MNGARSLWILCGVTAAVLTVSCRSVPDYALAEGSTFSIGEDILPAAPEGEMEILPAPSAMILQEEPEPMPVEEEIVPQQDPPPKPTPVPVDVEEVAEAKPPPPPPPPAVKRMVAKDETAKNMLNGGTPILAERPPQKVASRRIPQLESIYFNYNSYELSPSAISQLERVFDYLSQRPSLQVQIQGNTDNRGTTEYNYNLGEKRASQVREWLIEHGINPATLYSLSFGEENPVQSEAREESWSKNRRVDFFVY